MSYASPLPLLLSQFILYFSILCFVSYIVVDCLDPGTPANGIKLGFSTTYQSVVSYACQTGYAMRGDSQRTCQASGDWTGSVPLCELVDCGDPGTPRNGLKAGTNYKFQGRVSYSCNNGFQLSGSQTRTCQASGSWSGTIAACLGEDRSRFQHCVLIHIMVYSCTLVYVVDLALLTELKLVCSCNFHNTFPHCTRSVYCTL